LSKPTYLGLYHPKHLPQDLLHLKAPRAQIHIQSFQSPQNKSYSAAVAVTATVNPQYAALLATLASIANKE
jgi:hypothetical protein